MNVKEIQQIVRAKLAEFLDREVTLDELDNAYYDLGADSMDLVVLAHQLEDEYKVEISPEIFLQHDSINEAIVALLAEMKDD